MHADAARRGRRRFVVRADYAPVYVQALPSANDTMLQQVNIRQLHDSLNLSADQEVQWQAALDAMCDTMPPSA